MRRAALVAGLMGLAVACGAGSTSSTASMTPAITEPTPPSARAFTILVVTHTTGFRHSSIPAAEATIASLGDRSGLFNVRYCRNADDVAHLLTADALKQ